MNDTSNAAPPPRIPERQLPLWAAPRPPRADAARNRRRVLETAAELIRHRGVADVSMSEIARAAGVGKGTVYRAFGSRRALVEALLDEHERELQEEILHGSPPVGPGADPARRLAAFAHAYVAFLDEHLDLVIEVESVGGEGRLRSSAYGFWHGHVMMLLRAAGAPSPLVTAHLVLAGLSGDTFRHLQSQGVAAAEVAARVAALMVAATQDTDR